uniref:ascorbate ferrireductase (transmembrane) n=1 Tax=Strigamia maritima TaxID=126957 RepID=T1IH96_STRMM
MSAADDSPRMQITIGNLTYNALMDTGATQCFIGQQMLAATGCLPEYIQEAPKNMVVCAVGINHEPVGQVTLSVEWHDFKTPMNFYILRDEVCSLIIGHNFRRRVGLNLHTEEGYFSCTRAPGVHIPYVPYEVGFREHSLKLLHVFNNTAILANLDWDERLVAGSDCTAEQRLMLKDVLTSVRDVFRAKIPRHPFRTFNPAKKAIMIKLVVELEALGLIERATGNYISYPQQAFDRLKDLLCADKVLLMPDLAKPFVVLTDASHQGLGAVLCQDLDCMLMIYEGIGLFSPKNGLLDGKSNETKRNTHSFLLGAYGIFWGFTIVTVAKFQHNITHFASLHSTLGACAGGFTLFQGLGGLATRFQKLSPVTPKNMKFGHALCGVFQYLFTCLAFITGIGTDYMTIRTTPLIQIILISVFGPSHDQCRNHHDLMARRVCLILLRDLAQKLSPSPVARFDAEQGFKTPTPVFRALISPRVTRAMDKQRAVTATEIHNNPAIHTGLDEVEEGVERVETEDSPNATQAQYADTIEIYSGSTGQTVHYTNIPLSNDERKAADNAVALQKTCDYYDVPPHKFQNLTELFTTVERNQHLILFKNKITPVLYVLREGLTHDFTREGVLLTSFPKCQ